MTQKENRKSRVLEFLAKATELRKLDLSTQQAGLNEETRGSIRGLIADKVTELSASYENDLRETPERDYLLAMRREYGTGDFGPETQAKLDHPITYLDLSVRSSNCLDSADVYYVGQLVQKTDEDLLGIRSFGKTGLREVKIKLEELDLELGMTIDYIPPVKTE